MRANDYSDQRFSYCLNEAACAWSLFFGVRLNKLFSKPHLTSTRRMCLIGAGRCVHTTGLLVCVKNGCFFIIQEKGLLEVQ